jgi:hypothetical protein
MTALVRIAGMFLVILVGFRARRRGVLSAEATGALGRLVVDVGLPALILSQMVATVDLETLRVGWPVPLVAVATGLVAWGVGVVTSWLLAPGASRPTYVFCVATPNWVYLPLPVAASLFGETGRLCVLLYNVGGMVMLWTLGLWTLRGGRLEWSGLKDLARNPGLLATVGGVALALAFPGLRALPGRPDLGGVEAGVVAVLQALDLVGSLTVPLSLVLIGSQLGAWDLWRGGTRTLWGMVVSRLVLAPGCVMALGWVARTLGWSAPDAWRLTIYLVVAMPVAVNCGVFAERFGGDVALASRGIFLSTLLSMATAPGVLYLARLAGL